MKRRTVIHRSATPATLYYGAPDIVRLGSALICKFVEFGASAHGHDTDPLYDRSHFYRSTDGGVTWSALSSFDGFYFGGFVRHLCTGSNLVLVGNATRKGGIVVLKSTDSGATWTSYAIAAGVTLSAVNEVGQAVIGGTLYVPAVRGSAWYPFDEVFLLACGENADVTNSANWTVGSSYTRVEADNPDWATTWGINEPCVVETDAGTRVLCRIDSSTDTNELNRQLVLSASGTTLSKVGYRTFDGGFLRFHAIRDSATDRFFCVRNSDPVNDGQDRRHKLAVDSSDDLTHWRRIAVLSDAPAENYASEGEHYPAAFIDGDDLLVVCRYAEPGIAINDHDNNAIAFHRLENFRKL